MNTRMWLWFALPFLLLLSGCPDGGGGGDVVFRGATASVVYVANSGSNDISAYTMNTGTGALTPVAGSPLPGVTVPSALAVSPNGFFAYVANQGGANNISGFLISTTTGSLTPVPGSRFPTGRAPNAVTVSPNSEFLYVTNRDSNDVTAFTIGASGALTLVPNLVANPNPALLGGTMPTGITVSPNGQFLYVANLGGGGGGEGTVSAYTITAGTGVLTPVPNSPFLAGTTPSGLSVDPTSRFLYVANDTVNKVSAYTITAGTGELVPVDAGLGNPFSAGATPSGVMVSPNGAFLYVSNRGSNNVSAFRIDGTTGALTDVTGSPFTVGTTPSGVTISPDGSFLYVSNQVSENVSAFRIDGTTGALTAVTGSPFPAEKLPGGIAAPGRP